MALLSGPEVGRRRRSGAPARSMGDLTARARTVVRARRRRRRAVAQEPERTRRGERAGGRGERPYKRETTAPTRRASKAGGPEKAPMTRTGANGSSWVASIETGAPLTEPRMTALVRSAESAPNSSGPMNLCSRNRASYWAKTRTRLARSVNRSNISLQDRARRGATERPLRDRDASRVRWRRGIPGKGCTGGALRVLARTPTGAVSAIPVWPLGRCGPTGKRARKNA